MKFLDLFSGIGGFRLAFERAGHECVGFCEIDETAVKAYKSQFMTGEEWFCNDINESKDLPQADIWCFGFPCQDISIANAEGNGLNGERSGLFRSVIKLLQKEKNKPKLLVIENVKNIISVNRGTDFARLLIMLDEVGYDAEWEIINSKHFGVPQNRERVYVVGHLRGESEPDIFPIPRITTGTLKGWQGDVSGKGYKSQQDRVNTYDGIACCLPKARAITKNKVLLKDGTIRVLSGVERLRCQGFPEQNINKIIGSVGDRAACELAGNSVTVDVVYEIAKRIQK